MTGNRRRIQERWGNPLSSKFRPEEWHPLELGTQRGAARQAEPIFQKRGVDSPKVGRNLGVTIN
jgi:hypothetical protein